MPQRLTVDRFGRVVIPKPLRERYGWEAGSEIEVREDEDGLRLLVATRTPLPRGLAVRSGHVVYEAPWANPDGAADPARAVLLALHSERAIRQGAWS